MSKPAIAPDLYKNLNDLEKNLSRIDGQVAFGGITLGPGVITPGMIGSGTFDPGMFGTGWINGVMISDGSITANHIQANTITANLIQAHTITANEIFANTITANEIHAGTITAGEIMAHTITADLIQAGTITANEILAHTITANEIFAKTITAAEIKAGTITASEIQAGSITATQIAATTILAGNIKARTITANEILAHTITANEITAGTITATEIKAGTITAGNIAAGTITATNITTHTLTALQIAAHTITANEIFAKTITAGEIAAGTITATEILSHTITANEIASHSITSAEILAGTITATEISAGSITATKISVGGVLGDSLILDPSFESATADSTWKQYSFIGLPPGPTNAADDAIDGVQSLKIIGTASSGSYVASNVIPVTTSDSYVVRIKARGTVASTSGLFIQIHQYTSLPASNTVVPASTTVLANNNPFNTTWTDYEYAYTVPIGVKYITMVVGNRQAAPSGTTAYFDAAEFRKQIGAVQIESGAITASKIAAHTITANEIAADTITATEIHADAITTSELAADSVTSAKILAGTIVAGDIAADTITAGQIAATTITAAEIATDTITAGQIATNAITATELAADSVTSAKILAGTIVAIDIQSATITTTQIAAGTITGGNIAGATITGGNIAGGTVTGGNIAGATVTASNISVSSLSALSANLGTVTSGTVTGATLQTATTGARVVIDTTGINAYATDGTTKVLQFKTSDGSLAITGALLTGSAIPASSITGQLITAQISDLAITAQKLGVSMGGANMLTDSSFAKAGLVNWTTGNDTLAVDTGVKRPGTSTSSAKLTALGVGNTSIRNAIASRIPASPGVSYVASAYFLSSTITRLCRVYLDFYDSGGVRVGSSPYQGGNFTSSTTAWTRCTVTATAPANTSVVAIICEVASNAGAGEIHYVDDAQVEAGDVVTAWAPRPDEILPGFVGNTELADLAVNAQKIADATVTGTKIAAQTIVAGNILTGAITANEIAADAITTSELAANSVVAAKINAHTITALQIAAGTITASEILANTITAGQIAGTTITAAQIASGTITATQIQANTITTNEILAGTIVASDIATGTITALQIAGDTITANQIAANAIGTTELVAGAVTTNKLNVILGGSNGITNSSFENSTNYLTDWSFSGASANAPETSIVHSNGQSLKLTISGAFSGPFWQPSGRRMAVSPGETVTASIWLFPQVNTSVTTRLHQWSAVTGGTESTVDSPTGLFSVVGGQWNRVVATFTVPASGVAALGCQWFVWDGTVGNVHIWDDAQLERGDVATAYSPKTSEILPTTITGAMIQANTISAANLTATAIDTMSITLAAGLGKVQTSAANPKVQLDSTGLWAKNLSGTDTFRIDATTGSVTITGTLTATSVIPTAALTGNISPGNIATNTITGTMIQGGAITTGHMTANTIAGDRITANTLDAAKITSGTITTDRFTANTIAGTIITTGTLNADKIVSGSITTGQMTSGTINADRLITGSITTNLMTSNTINADRLLAGTILADKIAAGAITANKFDAVSTRSDNLILDPSFEGTLANSPWVTAQEGGPAFAYDVGGVQTDGAQSLRLAPAGSAATSNIIPVSPGDTYTVRVKAKADSVTTAGRYVRLTEWNVKPASNSTTRTSLTDMAANAAFNTAWTTYEYTYTVPAGVKYVALSLYNWTGGAANAWFDEAEVRKQIGTVHIENGAITATKITVATLSAISADVGTLSAGTIQGPQIQTAAANPRIVINTTAIFAKDSAGADTFRINAATGAVTITGTLTATSVVPSAALSGNIPGTQLTPGSVLGGVGGAIAATTIDGSNIATNAITANKINVIFGGGNRVTNSSFENNASFFTGWNAAGELSAAKETTQVHNGGASAKITSAGTGGMGVIWEVSGTGRYPVDPGTKVTMSGWIRPTVANRELRVYARPWTAVTGGTMNGSVLLATIPNAPVNVWTRVIGTYTVPASGVAAVGIYLYVLNSLVNEVYYFDDAQIEDGDYATSWAPKNDEILPTTITGGMIQTTAIDAMTITGATFRTAASGARVEMTSAGLKFYESGGAVSVDLSSAGGGLNLLAGTNNSPPNTRQIEWLNPSGTPVTHIGGFQTSSGTNNYAFLGTSGGNALTSVNVHIGAAREEAYTAIPFNYNSNNSSRLDLVSASANNSFALFGAYNANYGDLNGFGSSASGELNGSANGTYNPFWKLNSANTAMYVHGSSQGGYGLQVNRWGSGSIGGVIAAGTNTGNGNGAFLSYDGYWNSTSVAEVKENFRDVTLLDKIATIPIQEWNYKPGLVEDFDDNSHYDYEEHVRQTKKSKHIGPTADDFYKAFPDLNGEENRSIAINDLAGLALGGVRELIQKLQNMQTEIDYLRSKVDVV